MRQDKSGGMPPSRLRVAEVESDAKTSSLNLAHLQSGRGHAPLPC